MESTAVVLTLHQRLRDVVVSPGTRESAQSGAWRSVHGEGGGGLGRWGHGGWRTGRLVGVLTSCRKDSDGSRSLDTVYPNSE